MNEPLRRQADQNPTKHLFIACGIHIHWKCFNFSIIKLGHYKPDPASVSGEAHYCNGHWMRSQVV